MKHSDCAGDSGAGGVTARKTFLIHLVCVVLCADGSRNPYFTFTMLQIVYKLWHVRLCGTRWWSRWHEISILLLLLVHIQRLSCIFSFERGPTHPIPHTISYFSKLVRCQVQYTSLWTAIKLSTHTHYMKHSNFTVSCVDGNPFFTFKMLQIV